MPVRFVEKSEVTLLKSPGGPKSYLLFLRRFFDTDCEFNEQSKILRSEKGGGCSVLHVIKKLLAVRCVLLAVKL